MIKLFWNKISLKYESLEWSGTHNQCSREISFTLPWNPYDRDFKNYKIKLGDLIYMYDDKDKLFVGTITSREKSAEIGTASYTAMDFMHHLLRSSASYKFKNTTPEKITKQVCGDAKVPVGELPKTKCNIAKMIVEESSLYDIIVSAYRKVSAITKKKYMPVMDGKKVSVIVKGKKSGVTLTQGVDITAASYSDTTGNMVNVVNIYNDSLKQLGQVKAKTVDKYGVYMQAYTKEKGVNAKEEAESMFVGVTKEASVEAIGNIKAISGRSIVIKDKATGLSGTFYITSDTHTFSGDTHMMTLELSWTNERESGNPETKTDKMKNPLTNKSKCYYLDGSSVYHSSTSCVACKGKKTKSSTVAEMKKIKLASGENKGKRKYKPCSKCWED